MKWGDETNYDRDFVSAKCGHKNRTLKQKEHVPVHVTHGCVHAVIVCLIVQVSSFHFLWCSVCSDPLLRLSLSLCLCESAR